MSVPVVAMANKVANNDTKNKGPTVTGKRKEPSSEFDEGGRAWVLEDKNEYDGGFAHGLFNHDLRKKTVKEDGTVVWDVCVCVCELHVSRDQESVVCRSLLLNTAALLRFQAHTLGFYEDEHGQIPLIKSNIPENRMFHLSRPVAWRPELGELILGWKVCFVLVSVKRLRPPPPKNKNKETGSIAEFLALIRHWYVEFALPVASLTFVAGD